MKVLDNDIDLYIEVTSICEDKIIRFLTSCINSPIFNNNPNIRISLLNQCQNLDLSSFHTLIQSKKLLVKTISKIPTKEVSGELLIPFAKIRDEIHKISKAYQNYNKRNILLVVDDDLQFTDKSFEGFVTSANLMSRLRKHKISGIFHITKTSSRNRQYLKINTNTYYSYNDTYHTHLETGFGIMLPFLIFESLPDYYTDFAGSGEDVLYGYHASKFGSFLVTYNISKFSKTDRPSRSDWVSRKKVNKNYDMKWLRHTKGTMQNYLRSIYHYTENDYHWNPHYQCYITVEDNLFNYHELPDLQPKYINGVKNEIRKLNISD